MRNIVLVICTLCLVTTAQLSAQSIQTTQQVVGQVQQAVTAPAQSAVQSAVQPAVQSHTTYKPVMTTTAEPAVYQEEAYSTYEAYQPQQQYYYQNYRAPVQNYRPVRQANYYGRVPITQRPNRPGHVYGNTVRFLYRLGR